MFIDLFYKSLDSYITNLAESLHHVLSADHVLRDDGPEPLRPFLGARLVVHDAHFGFLQTFGVHRSVVVAGAAVYSLKKGIKHVIL